MSEWNDPGAKVPVDGQHVDVRLPDGRLVTGVQYAAGRFWKVRRGQGGHAYDVESWRDQPREEPVKRSRRDGSDEGTD